VLLETKDAELTAKEIELASLREFKASIEAETVKAEKLSQIKEKFAGAGIEKTDSYFADNAEFLLNLGEAGLDFLVQELVAFVGKTSEASSKVTIPNLVADRNPSTDIKSMAEALRSIKAK